MADKEESEKTIAEDLVVTKYKMAGDIVNRKYPIRGFTINIYSHLLCLQGLCLNVARKAHMEFLVGSSGLCHVCSFICLGERFVLSF